MFEPLFKFIHKNASFYDNETSNAVGRSDEYHPQQSHRNRKSRYNLQLTENGGREIFSLCRLSFCPKLILLRFYTGLLTDFTTKTYNIGVLKRKVQKINVKGDIENEKDY